MQDAFAHCEQLVREHDKDRFLATLFAPADRRKYLLALYAFALEIGRVKYLVHEPMAGIIRLQWWRDAVSWQELSGCNGGAMRFLDCGMGRRRQIRLPLRCWRRLPKLASIEIC
ncbi:MAG: squalene/phytoene synthase family protein [Xanthobacteraceae bacterium]